jgi:hypothetical protein
MAPLRRQGDRAAFRDSDQIFKLAKRKAKRHAPKARRATLQAKGPTAP